jgi:hypothetical protein
MDVSDVGELREDDRVCLEQLGQYLVSTDAWRRFGIWLLHKHFEPEPGEVFVEHTMRAPRKSETTPIERSAFEDQELSTTAIRFDNSVSRTVGVIGMEFAHTDDFGDTLPLSDDDEAVLAGIAERLRAHDKIERFGVRLIRNPLGLAEHELLHETCDSAARTLHCAVVSATRCLPTKPSFKRPGSGEWCRATPPPGRMTSTTPPKASRTCLSDISTQGFFL